MKLNATTYHVILLITGISGVLLLCFGFLNYPAFQPIKINADPSGAITKFLLLALLGTPLLAASLYLGERRNAPFFWYCNRACAGLAFFVLFYFGARTFLNGYLDRSAPRCEPLIFLDYRTSRPGGGYSVLARRPSDSDHYYRISNNEFNRPIFLTRQPLEVYIRQGYFAIAWIERYAAPKSGQKACEPAP